MCKVTMNGKVCGKVFTIHIENKSNLKNHILNRHGEIYAAKELQKYIDKKKEADKIRNRKKTDNRIQKAIRLNFVYR